MSTELNNLLSSDDALWQPVKWSTYMLHDIFRARKGPVLGETLVHVLEEKARKKFQDENNLSAFLFLFGSAGTGLTFRFNVEAFQKYRIIPRMLRDTSHVDISTTILGRRYPSPLILGPIGVQGIIHAEADNASSRAASKLNVPFVMSTSSTRSIESVAESSGNGPRWYQLYQPTNEDITESLLKRIKASGFTVLVVTLDASSLGWRPYDLNVPYVPFGHGVGTAVGLSDPVYMAKHGEKPFSIPAEYPYDAKKVEEQIRQGDPIAQTRLKLGLKWLEEISSGNPSTWEDLAVVRKYWDGPILLKGIQSVEDAEEAIEYADGIIVSNHGGRQIDGAIASLDALNKIGKSAKVRAAQESGKFTVLFDSGVRTGSDVLKAIILGAQGVLLGRPYMYGLALGGEAGVDQIIRSILAETELSLKLSGHNTIQDIWHRRQMLEFPEDRSLL